MARHPMEAVRNLTGAWIARDREGMSRWVTDDITELTPERERAISGRRNFLAWYRACFRGPLRILSYRILGARTIPLSRTAVLVYFRYRMLTRDGNRLIRSHGKESMVVQKERGGWRVRFIHWHRDGQSGAEVAE